MAQLRNFQLFRNQDAFAHASHEAAIAAFKVSTAWTNMQDGEILLYSYTVNGEENSPVHSLIGVVRNHKLDIITNEGTLREVVKDSINALDSKVSTWEYNANGDRVANTNSVNVEIIQTDGKLTRLEVDYSNLTNVLDALDFTHELQNTDNKTFKIFATEQQNGLISEEVDGTIVFDRALVTTGETQNLAATTGYVKDAIDALDVTNVNVATLTDGVVEIYNVKEEDGKIAQNNRVVILAKVATTGAATDVAVADAGSVITATTVEGALQEIATEINAMDLAATDVVAMNEDNNALQASKISEVDGKVSVETAATIVEFNQAISSDNKVATMADLTAAEYAGENAIVVDNAANKISLNIAANDPVLSQSKNGLASTIALSYDSESTTIKLTGFNGANLGEINATNFVKDGILEDVVIVEGTGTAEEGQTEVLEDGHKYFRFTYKTVYYDENNDTVDTTKVVYLDVESLVDAYTADETWIHIEENANTISHKTQSGIVIAEGQSTVTTATASNSVATTAGIATITVPQLTIDAAGHITKQENNSYEIDLPVTAVANVAGQTVVTSAVAEGTNDTTYTVGLAEVTVETKTETNTMADTTATHSYIKSIEYDAYGRVIKVVTETMTENFDMGQY